MPSLAAANLLRAAWRASEAILVARLLYLDDLSEELEFSRLLVLLAGTLFPVQESHLFVVYIDNQRILARAKYEKEHQVALQSSGLRR